MKKVTIQTAIYPLLVQGGRSADGVLLDGEDVGLTHIVEAILRGKVDAAKKKNSEYQDTISASLNAQKALDEAFQTALDFSQVMRDHLKPKLGSRYSKAWNQVGFFNATLRLPQSYDGMQGLVGSMGLFLEAHPELNVPAVMTPEIAATIAGAIATAKANVGQANIDGRQKKTGRDKAMADLRQELIFLRRELSMLLTDDDPRWLSFGFNVPSDLTVPEVPEGVAVIPGGAGRALVSWAHAMRADRYHVYKQTVGVDAEPVRVATVRELSTDVGGLVSGSTVKFTVTALNAAGESLDSEVVELVVP